MRLLDEQSTQPTVALGHSRYLPLLSHVRLTVMNITQSIHLLFSNFSSSSSANYCPPSICTYLRSTLANPLSLRRKVTPMLTSKLGLRDPFNMHRHTAVILNRFIHNEHQKVCNRWLGRICLCFHHRRWNWDIQVSIFPGWEKRSRTRGRPAKKGRGCPRSRRRSKNPRRAQEGKKITRASNTSACGKQPSSSFTRVKSRMERQAPRYGITEVYVLNLSAHNWILPTK